MRKKKTGTVVGLDIEAASIAATELRVNGAASISAAAVAPLDAGALSEGEVTDGDALAESLRELFSANHLDRHVRLGIANQRVIVRTLRLPLIEAPDEMEAAIRFRAQDEIPMPLDQAVLDHQVVGGVPGEGDAPPQVDVVVVAARRDMIDAFLAPLRKAGLQPVGIDLSAFGMIRALAEMPQPVTDGADQQGLPPLVPATLFCNVGDLTNLAVARGRACLFTRVSQFGIEGVARELAAAHALTLEHARQWLGHVGLGTPVEEISGDPAIVKGARAELEDGAGILLNELRRSLEYYGGQQGVPPVERVVLCGPGSAVPGLAGHLAAGLGMACETGRPEALASYGDERAARLTLSYGLALEG